MSGIIPLMKYMNFQTIYYDSVVPKTLHQMAIYRTRGHNKTGYSRITISCSSILRLFQDPKSSFKCKLLLFAAVGAHCMDGLLSIEDDQHWKSLSTNCQRTFKILLQRSIRYTPIIAWRIRQKYHQNKRGIRDMNIYKTVSIIAFFLSTSACAEYSLRT